ncbi:hypothetical protein JCM15519_15560 [Fundidesulfovibrio butyratiphilus]
MNLLQRVLHHPLTELCVGLALLISGLLEMREIMLVKLPNRGPMAPHALALLGAALIARSLPAFFLGLDFVRQALPAELHGFLVRGLDRLTHCHAAALTMGLILVASGLADLVDLAAQPGAVWPINSAAGILALGLAPAIDALIAIYKGLRGVDNARPFHLLDRAVQNPWTRGLAGAAMLLGGLAELFAASSGHHLLGYGPRISRATAVLGLFGLGQALPGIYLGLRALGGMGRKHN